MISHILSPLCTEIQLYRFASILAFKHLKNNTEYIRPAFPKAFYWKQKLECKNEKRFIRISK